MLEAGGGPADRAHLAEALRTLRRASGLSGERLADRTGMSQSKISYALKGEEARDFIRAIADEFRSSEQNE